MKSNLALVAKQTIPAPVDDARLKKRMESLRGNLLAAAVRYVREGKDGTFGDRLRTASSLSGIPVTFIDVEARR